MDVKKLRNEYNQKGFRRKLLEAHGDRCVNCGEEMSEWHHVVPLALGGTNNLQNIVPLCGACHLAAHKGHHISKYAKKQRGSKGRPRKCENGDATLEKWVKGEIGTKEATAELGYSKAVHLKDTSVCREYLRRRGIVSVWNRVDITERFGKRSDGDVLSIVTYSDGREEKYLHEEEYDIIADWFPKLSEVSDEWQPQKRQYSPLESPARPWKV